MATRGRVFKPSLWQRFRKSNAPIKLSNGSFVRGGYAKSDKKPVILLNKLGKVTESKPVTENKNKLTSYIILGLLIFFSVSLFKNISNVRLVEKRIDDKAGGVEDLKKEQEALEKHLEYTKSQEFIEKQLRDQLGLAKEGEIVVVLPPPEVLRKFAPQHEEEAEVLPDPNWKKWMKLFT